mmetsp:Transcript_15546/g.26991  ORF Transcript_15546/g.26991 Transcript_15546/m.26991 type:complete len:253 (+) Transcript_15546:99-857(+)
MDSTAPTQTIRSEETIKCEDEKNNSKNSNMTFKQETAGQVSLSSSEEVEARDTSLSVDEEDGSHRHSSPQLRTNDDEDAAERARREEQESIELARMLMAEEAMASYEHSYAISMEYMRQNQYQFSAEDLAALQAAMEEDQDEAEEDADLEGPDNYELMLRLGERLGDVKSERWAQVAQQKIHTLPLISFNPDNMNEKDGNDCDAKCLICQCQYERGDQLRKLPCGHCFHGESCVDQWLLSKDFCPYCRTSLE